MVLVIVAAADIEVIAAAATVAVFVFSLQDKRLDLTTRNYTDHKIKQKT